MKVFLDFSFSVAILPVSFGATVTVVISSEGFLHRIYRASLYIVGLFKSLSVGQSRWFAGGVHSGLI